MAFVSQSEIEVKPETATMLESAFRARSRLVDQHDGFLGLELLRDIHRPGRYVLLTRWRNRESFRAYLTSADFKAAHQKQHDGLEESIGGAPLRQLEQVRLDELP